MNDKSYQLEINLLGKSYVFECLPQEQQQLLNAADYVNRWASEHINNEKMNSENIYAMTALNMASQLMTLQESYRKANTISERIKQTLNASQSQVSRMGVDL